MGGPQRRAGRRLGGQSQPATSLALTATKDDSADDAAGILWEKARASHETLIVAFEGSEVSEQARFVLSSINSTI